VIENDNTVAEALFIQPTIAIVAVRANSLVRDFIAFTLIFVVEQRAILGAGGGASHVPKKKFDDLQLVVDVLMPSAQHGCKIFRRIWQETSPSSGPFRRADRG
jgi:hypothetical protein